MRILSLKEPSGEALLRRVDPKSGAILYKTRTPLARGEVVLLEISFPGLPHRELLRAKVVELDETTAALADVKAETTTDPATNPPTNPPTNPAIAAAIDAQGGHRLAVLHDDLAARDHLYAFARGEIEIHEAAPRRHVRFPVEVPVDWQAARSDERYVSCIEDLGAGGAFVRTQTPPPPGTEVSLVIWNGDESMSIPGEVAWVREQGGSEGMGIRFLRATAGDARRLREVLRHMQERGKIDLVGSGSG